MLPLLFNLKFVLPALLFLNLISVFIYRQELRFLKGPILLFVMFFLIFLGYRFLISPGQLEKVQASRQAEIKKQGWNYLNLPEMDADYQKKESQYNFLNLLLFRYVGLQAAFGFIFCCIGLFTSANKNIYAGFALGFFMLAFLFLS